LADLHVAVIGGGIAGVAAAYHLASHPAAASVRVTLLEAEPTLAFHTTGRSAAQLIQNYGAGPVRPLTAASLGFFRSPPAELVDGPLLTTRGVLTVGGPDQDAVVQRTLDEGRSLAASIVEVSPAEAARLFPPLRTELVSRAVLEPDAADIDVAALHQGFVRGIRRAGGQVVPGTSVRSLRRSGSGWEFAVADATVGADIVVNAAGAWGDVVARSAGVEPVGLRPLRRTVFMTRSPHDSSARWPLVADAEHRWYVKPDGSQLLCSPADEVPDEPCDARPREQDVALGIERINAATTLAIRSVTATWAGLRTFTADRSMVIGPDPIAPSFVWLVGQGGTGIQTAPGAGRLVADLILEGRPGADFDGTGLDLAALSPDRFGDGPVSG
jgi:D-arginine dehydrogenase